jgi:tetratricopeptide (TPR) repeat protein
VKQAPFVERGLLEQIEGVERGLRQRRRFGLLGYVGLTISAIQGGVLVLNEWAGAFEQFRDFFFDQGWPLALLAGTSVASLFILGWNRFWLRESEQPFRYTYSVAEFKPAEGSPRVDEATWLRSDLIKRLSRRIARLSWLEESGDQSGGLPDDSEEESRANESLTHDSHIHVSGYYFVRPRRGGSGVVAGGMGETERHRRPPAERASEWELEIVPWVRVGPEGRPRSLAHPVVFNLGLMSASDDAHRPLVRSEARGAEGPPRSPEPSWVAARPRHSSPETESPPHKAPSQPGEPVTASTTAPPLREATEKDGSFRLGVDKYSKLVERVYFSVVTRIYTQIRTDVETKIGLLPSNRFRAVAYFHEAEDYARSNTLDAYDEARSLYEASIRVRDPTFDPLPSSPWRAALRKAARILAATTIRLRKAASRLWPRAGEALVLLSRAEIGYANMLIYRQLLAGLSGQRLNPVFEARPIARRAVERLRQLEGVPHQRRSLFDAYVTLAAVWSSLNSDRRARGWLEEARSLDPARAEEDSHYLFVLGATEPRVLSKLPLFRRASEADPDFEVARFYLALSSESLWRRRPSLEANVARDFVLTYYDDVTRLNPGNIRAWANMGYVAWLLGDTERAKEAFESGREYKEIKQTTFVAELDYGLARIAAEADDYDLEDAFKHYRHAVVAEVAEGAAYQPLGYGHTGYLFDRIGPPILKRFEKYLENVERHLRLAAAGAAASGNDDAERIRNAVWAFAQCEMAEACWNYYLESGHVSYLVQARDLFQEAITNDPEYVIPRFKLYRLLKNHSGDLPESAPILTQASASADDGEPYLDHLGRVMDLEPEWLDAKLAWSMEHASRALNAREEARDRRDDALASRADAGKKRIQAERSRSRISTPLSEQLLGPIDMVDYPAKLDEQAVALEEQAEELEHRATSLDNEAKGLDDQASKAQEEAARLLQTLLPHEWLWSYELRTGKRELLPTVLAKGSFRADRRWEREFNDINATALFTWAKVLLALEQADPDVTERDAPLSRRLLFHVHGHFWKDDFELLLLMLQKRIRPPKESLAKMAKRWISDDPVAIGALMCLIRSPGRTDENVDRRVARSVQQFFVNPSTCKFVASRSRWGWRFRRLSGTPLAVEAKRRARLITGAELSALRRSIPDISLRESLGLLVTGALDDPPEPFWALTWLVPVDGIPLIPVEERIKRLRAVIQRDDRSSPLYYWAGLKLVELSDNDSARLAFRRAAAEADLALLWELAARFEQLRVWDDSLEAYRRLLEAHQRGEPGLPESFDPGLCRRGIAVALWTTRFYREGLGEFAGIGTSSPEQPWREGLVDRALDAPQIHIGVEESYRSLKALLEHDQGRLARAWEEASSLDAGRALVRLEGAKFPRVVQEASGDRPMVADEGVPDRPLIMETDPDLFPELANTPVVSRLIEQDLPAMRSRVREAMGVAPPGTNIRIGGDLREGAYRLLLHEVPLAWGTVRVGGVYCPEAEACRGLGLEGTSQPNPDKSGKGLWLGSDTVHEAEQAGLDLWDPHTYIVRHLEYLVRDHLSCFLGVEQLEDLLEMWTTDDPARSLAIERAIPSLTAKARLVAMMRRLLDENVPVRNLGSILKAFAATERLHLAASVEHVRFALRSELPGRDGGRRFLALAAEFENVLSARLRSRRPRIPGEDMGNTDWFVEGIRQYLGRVNGPLTLVVRKRALRPMVRALLRLSYPDLPVLALREFGREPPAFAIEIPTPAEVRS